MLQAFVTTEKQRMWGLGERKGPFFLPDKSRVALWSNGHNLPAQKQNEHTTYFA